MADACTETGLFPNVPFEVYESWPGLRKSRLWTLISRTAKHYRYELDHPEEVETEALFIGAAVHCAVLEPERFKTAYVTGGPINPRTQKPYGRDTEKFAAWAKTAGGIPIKEEEQTACLAMRESVLAHPVAAMLLKVGQPEMSMQWRDVNTAMLMKGRIDWWVDKGCVMVDLKTTGCAAPHAFGGSAYRYGYHVQSSLYWDGLLALTGEAPALPVIIAVEKTPPYCCAVYEVEQAELELGRSQYKFALERIRDCEKAGQWPGYSADLLTLQLPAYAGMEVHADAPVSPSEADDENLDNELGI